MESLNCSCMVLALDNSLIAAAYIGIQRSIFFAIIEMMWFVRYFMKNVFLLPSVPLMK